MMEVLAGNIGERGKRKCRQKEETEVSDQVTSFQCHPLI